MDDGRTAGNLDPFYKVIPEECSKNKSFMGDQRNMVCRQRSTESDVTILYVGHFPTMQRFCSKVSDKDGVSKPLFRHRRVPMTASKAFFRVGSLSEARPVQMYLEYRSKITASATILSISPNFHRTVRRSRASTGFGAMNQILCTAVVALR